MNTTLNMLVLDHLAVAAASLGEGAAHVTAALGVAPLPGGHHPVMEPTTCSSGSAPAPISK